MEIINNKLIASDGMTLTNGEAFGKAVHLAVDADAAAWYEITDAEAEVLKKDIEDALAKEYEEMQYEIDQQMYVEN